MQFFIRKNVQDAARIIGCSYEELAETLSFHLKRDFLILPAGTRYQRLCRMSDLGKDQFPTHRYDLGRVVGFSKRTRDMLRVSWYAGEGVWKNPQWYHRDYIENLKH